MSIESSDSIIVFGGDGYIGWPLSVRLAASLPGCSIIIVDTGWRRKTVEQLGYHSLTNVLSLADRIKSLKAAYPAAHISYCEFDIDSEQTDALIRKEQPRVVFHLAHQPSGPYSMAGVDEAIFTVKNNEAGNLRLLWAIRTYSPDTHIIKLGSMGQYAGIGLDVPEGYFIPAHNGTSANREVMFYREASDVYHISKINDSNFVAMACRQWGLRVTDVMQSAVFGLSTKETDQHPDLINRFDYDPVFGTVINRFLVQIVQGHPLTVYGSGNQRSGFMMLDDVVESLVYLAGCQSEPGVHRVINHAAQTRFSINEIAAEIINSAATLGIYGTICHSFDPREENSDRISSHKVATDFLDENIAITPFSISIVSSLTSILCYKDAINASYLVPGFDWNKPNVETFGQHGLTATDNDFETLRLREFPTDRINLNPGTMGTMSRSVIAALDVRFDEQQLFAAPLEIYRQHTRIVKSIVNLAGQIWPLEGYSLIVSHSTTQLMNVLCLRLLSVCKKQRRCKVLMSSHEHYGASSAFVALDDYDVTIICDEDLCDNERFRSVLVAFQPDICLFSEYTFDTCEPLPVSDLCKAIKTHLPSTVIIIDVAQSLGIRPIPVCEADILIGSAHKWLFGPQGSGFAWVSDCFRDKLNGCFFSGLHSGASDETYLMQGGLDFYVYSAIRSALVLYHSLGSAEIYQRSCELCRYFESGFSEVFLAAGIEYRILNSTPAHTLSIGFTYFDPYPLYDFLNTTGIHLKCIKDVCIHGNKMAILRIGFPYYESKPRLKKVLDNMRHYLNSGIDQLPYHH